MSDFNLPKAEYKPELLELITQTILGVETLQQSTLEMIVPFYKVAVYSKALAEILQEADTKVIDLKWGEKYIPPTYELLETKRGTIERLLTSGLILVKRADHPILIHFRPTFSCQVLTIYGKDNDVKYLEDLSNQIQKYVYENNYWKNEQITPLGKYLEVENITKDALILDHSILESLEKTVLNFFSNQEKYKKANIPFKRGVIFSGLPGTGKTLSGKLIMNSLQDITFIWVTAEVFGVVGVSSLFKMARELQPAVLFIEDVDRCLTGSTLDELKTQMDGLESCEGILTILSTNHPHQLPKTLIDRPGRFDDIIEYSLPSADLRYQLLVLYSKQMTIQNRDQTLREIAKISSGLTPAHLKELVVRTYMLKEGEITLEDLKTNLSRLIALHNKFKSVDPLYTKEISPSEVFLGIIKGF